MKTKKLILLLTILFLFFLFSCEKEETNLPISTSGFISTGTWIGDYWPTEEWRTCTPEEVGMDSEKLKAEFGEKIVFWGGGSDTQQVLPGGTKEEIQKHVNEQIKTFSPGGGFVFAQVHNIQADVPAANIVSMMDEAKKFR